MIQGNRNIEERNKSQNKIKSFKSKQNCRVLKIEQ